MIIYFADRKMRVLGNASTGLPRGFTASADKKTEDIDSGIASFECTISFEKNEQKNFRRLRKPEIIFSVNIKRKASFIR